MCHGAQYLCQYVVNISEYKQGKKMDERKIVFFSSWLRRCIIYAQTFLFLRFKEGIKWDLKTMWFKVLLLVYYVYINRYAHISC
jgi:hypothetical protein